MLKGAAHTPQFNIQAESGKTGVVKKGIKDLLGLGGNKKTSTSDKLFNSTLNKALTKSENKTNLPVNQEVAKNYKSAQENVVDKKLHVGNKSVANIKNDLAPVTKKLHLITEDKQKSQMPDVEGQKIVTKSHNDQLLNKPNHSQNNQIEKIINGKFDTHKLGERISHGDAVTSDRREFLPVNDTKLQNSTKRPFFVNNKEIAGTGNFRIDNKDSIPSNGKMNLYTQNDSAKSFLRAVDDRVVSFEKSAGKKIGIDKTEKMKIGKEFDILDNFSNRIPNQLTPVNQNQVNQNDIGSGKVFQMDSMINSSDRNQIIDQISTYINQVSTANKSHASMSVNHETLGQIDISVDKNRGSHDLNILIKTHTNEGSEFFSKNQNLLLSALHTSGVKTGEFKLDSSQSFGQEKGSDSGNFARNSESGYNQRDRQEDSERRRDLWNRFYGKDVA